MSRNAASGGLSVIVPASNEEAHIDAVLEQVLSLEPLETIVVVNGSTDRTAEIATARGARVVESAERLGHDVGRAIGASAARGANLLFVDADIVIPASDLRPFAAAVADGHDVALNDIDTLVSRYPWDPVSIQKIWLNACLGRLDLGTASLTAIPHALGPGAFRHSRPEDLMVPPRAYAKLVRSGADVVKAHTVDVVTTNKVHDQRVRPDGSDRMTEMIVGDHLEALAWLLGGGRRRR